MSNVEYNVHHRSQLNNTCKKKILSDRCFITQALKIIKLKYSLIFLHCLKYSNLFQINAGIYISFIKLYKSK